MCDSGDHTAEPHSCRLDTDIPLRSAEPDSNRAPLMFSTPIKGRHFPPNPGTDTLQSYAASPTQPNILTPVSSTSTLQVLAPGINIPASPKSGTLHADALMLRTSLPPDAPMCAAALQNTSTHIDTGQVDTVGQVQSISHTRRVPSMQAPTGPPVHVNNHTSSWGIASVPGKGLDTSWLQGARSSSTDTQRRRDGVLPLGIGGWTPPKRVAPLHREVVNQEQQLNAYIAWVNSQLKRKPGTRLVDDLRTDMQDGVALLFLIEVVAGEKLTDVYPVPSNTQEMRDNVQRVLQFMAARRIRMHHITAKDIVDGNLKSIMRLILALAAHFKPSSVKHHNTTTSHHGPSITSIAQGAVAALADARCDAASVGQRVKRLHGSSPRGNKVNVSGADSDHSGGSDHTRQRSYYDASQMDSVYPTDNLGSRLHETESLSMPTITKSKSQDFDLIGQSHGNHGDVHQRDTSAEALNHLVQDHNSLLEELHSTKKTLLQLQDLLLSNSLGNENEIGEQETLPFEGITSEQEVVILRSRLQQSGELCNDLREELSQLKNEVMQLQGTKAGLQKRMSEQEEAFLKLKAELLRLGFAQQTLESEKVELQRKLNEKEKLVIELKKKAGQKDQQLEELANEFHSHLQEKDDATHNMRSQIESLHERLCHAGDSESYLSAKVASQDRKMQRLEGKLVSGDSAGSCTSSLKSAQSVSSEDLQLVHDSLRSLRTCFAGNDPQHHTIDALEQSITNLMEKLHMTERQSGHRNGLETTPRRVNYDSTGDIRRSPITALHGLPLPRIDMEDITAQQQTVTAPQQSTKVLYFTDRTVTPFMCTIPKRLGDIRLYDLKQIFDRSGNYRYHFKAMDPEFGTVKEEISSDDAIIPGWEGKIVAWIEEDHG